MASSKDENEGQYKNVIELVDVVLRNGISKRASDIHFEPDRNAFNVRFRIDGFLYPVESFEKRAQEEIISRIKVLARMAIMERRFPQDGHFEASDGKKVYNVRVSTFPTLYGEAVVLRLLNREDVLVDFNSLGFEDDQLEIVKEIISSPYGMCIVTGPTGSGKTTLLYSILNALNKSETNIVTVEDPVEFQMNQVRQMQIAENIGLDYPKALRVIARQDPDVVMLGEIRDSQTIQMAVQTALSGVLMFTTFHTFDVAGLVIRLMEMGVPRSVVSHIIIGVISSRLVRKICPTCSAPYTVSDFEKNMLKETGVEGGFKKGKGCENCHETGYLGQTGIFEIVQFDEEIKSYIMEEKAFSGMLDLIRKKKIKTLWEAAMFKVKNGITTLDEVVRVIGHPRK